MTAISGVASDRVVRSFKIQVAKATNGQKNGSAEESIVWLGNKTFKPIIKEQTKAK